jgi:hypothetical protein
MARIYLGRHVYGLPAVAFGIITFAWHDISLVWGKVEITTWTHKINGLTESDFILAAKIDQLYKP